MKRIKLIVADVDGTITDSNKKVDSGLKETIKVLRDHGIFFTLASGRNVFYMQDIVEELGIDLPFICNNGASVYLKEDKLFDYSIDKDVVKEIIQGLKIYSENFIYYSDTEILSYEADHILDLFAKRAKNKVRLGRYIDGCNHEGCFKITLDSGYNPKVDEFAKLINDKYPDVYFRQSESNLYTVTSSHATKGQALKWLIDYLNIDSEEVLAFGDNFNDISMLDMAGVSVVMDNGEKETKEHADYICKGNDENGVSRFLKEYFSKVL